MDTHGFTCEAMARLFERLVDGDLEARDEEALRAHVEGCRACRAKYALDLALIASIRTAPQEAFVSVAGTVVAGVRVKGRRRWVLGWGATVAAVSVLALATVQLGSRISEPVLSLLTGGYRTSPTYLALSKVAGLAVEFATVLRSMIFSGSTPGGLGSYAPEVALLTLMAGGLVIFMMYEMGRWLNKPREVNSWRRG